MPPTRPPLPSLDDPCGARHCFRDLVECGETFHRLAQAGLLPPAATYAPAEPETWSWMGTMCQRLLDPLEVEFGPCHLTYGYAGQWLLRHVKRGVAPRLDQHAGAEMGRTGGMRCPRGGFAVDLIVPSVPADVVARWLLRSVAIDRLYFYGDTRPLHVSVGPETAGYCATMVEVAGRRSPRPGLIAAR